MDYGVQSAALVVPRLRERVSFRLCPTNYFDSFQKEFRLLGTIQDDPEFMDFHHQEVVESVPELPSDPTPVPSSENVTVDDLDSLDTNDLFSFVLDNATLDNNPPDIKSTPKDTLASAFRTPVLDFEQPGDDISVPPDFISLLDLAASEDFLKDSLSLEDVSLDLESGISSLQPTSESSGGYNLPFFNSSSESGIEAMPAPQFDICSEEFGNCSDGSDAEEEERFTKRGDGRPGPVTMFLHNEDLARGKPGQRLVLSAEERRLLSRMGHKVPTMFPLSRNDERVIRAVRRKIRNKLSAKASRARRQEYLQTLEMRIHSCHKENERLRSRVGELEKEKRGLLANLRKMRSYLARLISGMPAVSNSSNGQQPLLPLTFSPVCKSQKSQSHGRSISFSKARSAAGGTSLLVVAFMILAWATIIPLPDFEISSRSLSNPVASVAGIVPSPVSSPTLFPGRSRTLLARSDPDKLGGLPPDQLRPDKLNKGLKSLAPQEAIPPNLPFPTGWTDEPPESLLVQRRDATTSYAMEDL
ncbi:hypothetical protein AAHC03_01434 [Spirometra sp. Aus1]